MTLINKYMCNAGLISVVINVHLISVHKNDLPYPMYDKCVHGNGYNIVHDYCYQKFWDYK
jgi:hypothetical protein